MAHTAFKFAQVLSSRSNAGRLASLWSDRPAVPVFKLPCRHRISPCGRDRRLYMETCQSSRMEQFAKLPGQNAPPWCKSKRLRHFIKIKPRNWSHSVTSCGALLYQDFTANRRLSSCAFSLFFLGIVAGYENIFILNKRRASLRESNFDFAFIFAAMSQRHIVVYIKLTFFLVAHKIIVILV